MHLTYAPNDREVQQIMADIANLIRARDTWAIIVLILYIEFALAARGTFRRGNIESRGDAGPMLRIHADEEIWPLRCQRGLMRLGFMRFLNREQLWLFAVFCAWICGR